MEQLSFLVFPFLACIALVLIHAYFGIHILERGIIFVDIAMAQFIGIGIALSFLLGKENHYLLALIFALFGSIILALSKKADKIVNLEAFIGVLYVFSFAVAILILDKSPHGSEEFKSILNGNILWVTKNDVLYAYLLYFLIGAFHISFREKFFSLTFEGRKNNLWEFLFFFTFGLVLVKSVVMAGVLTVFSFLIIPALIGRIFTKKFTKSLLIGYSAGTLATLISIFLSYKFDLPTSPLIVSTMSSFYFCTLIFKVLQNKEGRV
ncbi:MAG: metal ABC transporter permease [Thermoanaerobaculaceae bacterium]|nr:metal ABC transporter permease [Thermoanaerobaculaceae bacterium]